MKYTLNDLSLNVLDIALNSVKAGASLTEIAVTISTALNSLIITVRDNGRGFNIKEYENSKASAPEKKSGKGLILFKESAEITGGEFYITSKLGEGTFVKASYILESCNRALLGDMAETIAALALCEGIFAYTYTVNGDSFTLNTADITKILGVNPAKCPAAIKFIKDYIRENTDFINKKNFSKG